MKLCLICAGLAAVGCGKDVAGGGGPGSDPGPGSDGTPDAPAGAMVIDVSGHITANATWSDFVNVTGPLTIDAGVTVTVAPGTQIKIVNASTGIVVDGTFDVEATKDAPASIVPGTSGGHWEGFLVGDGAQLIEHYVIGNGGGIHITGTGKATLRDTQLSRDSHDLVTMAGGTLDAQYSWIGLEVRTSDTSHCDLHFGGNATITVSHSNISSAAYGLMIYSGVADFTYDNWFANSYDIDALPGVSADFSSGWFQKGTPAARTGFTFNTMSTTRLTDVGPR